MANIFVKSQFKPYLVVFVIYFLIILIFTCPVPFKMNSVVYGPMKGTDNRGALWSFWWAKYAYSNGLDSDKVSVLAAPYGQDWSALPNLWIWKFLEKWTSVFTNDIFAYNFWLLSTFLFAAFCMYLLVLHITNNIFAAFIAGLLYGFCPYHFNKSWEHYLLANIQWMPLYLLSVFKLHKQFSLKNIIFYLLAFTLILNFDFTYTYISMVIISFFSIFLILWNTKEKFQLLKKKSTKGEFFKNIFMPIKFLFKLVLVSILGMLINISLVMSVLKSMFISSGSSPATVDMGRRAFKYLFTQSARPLSYLLPASSHPILGGLSKSMFGSMFYGRSSIEHTLYLGWAALILAFVAYRSWKKKKLQNYIVHRISDKYDINFTCGFFIFSAVGFLLFSLPPYLNFGLFKIYLPAYFMYKILPMFRAYARFGIAVMLSVSVLAGLGACYILEKLKTSRARFIFVGLISCIILFEFANIPPLRVTDMSNPPAVYQWLAKQPGDFSIAEYPMRQALSGEAQIDYDYLLYQRNHQKKLINGATRGSHAYEVRKEFERFMDPKSPGTLKYLGAKYIIVHLDKYRGYRLADVVGSVPDFSKQPGVRLIKEFDNTQVYEIIAEPIEPSL